MTHRPSGVRGLAALCAAAAFAATYLPAAEAQVMPAPQAMYTPYCRCPAPAYPPVVVPVQPQQAQPQQTQPQQAQPQQTQPQQTQPQQPEPAPTPDTDLSERSGAVGGESVAVATPGVIGDMLGMGPALLVVSSSGNRKVVKIPTAVASGSFKISENESARPTNRIIFSFNYFADVNDSFNTRLGNLVGKMEVYRELIGFEKTLFDGQASIGMRLPLNTLSAGAGVSDPGGTFTDVGDLSIIGKYMFWSSDDRASLASGGLVLTIPTGPTNFAGATDQISSFHSFIVQPWLGFLVDNGTFYAQGFTSVAVPLDTNDVTYLFNDVSVGAYVYKNLSNEAYVRYLAPSLEVHINTPLSNRGEFSSVNGQADVVDLTQGLHIGVGRRGVLTLGVSEPVTGPKPYSIEGIAQFNFHF